MFNFVSDVIPIIIIISSIVIGLIEQKNIFELFKNGVYEGIKIIYKIFPIILGLLVATNIIKTSGILDIIGKVFLKNIIPSEIISLIFMRAVSASGAIAVVNEIFIKYGVDSIYGIFASIMLGATETAIYTIMIYGSVFKKNNYKIKPIIIIGLLGNFVATTISFILTKKFF